MRARQSSSQIWDDWRYHGFRGSERKHRGWNWMMHSYLNWEKGRRLRDNGGQHAREKIQGPQDDYGRAILVIAEVMANLAEFPGCVTSTWELHTPTKMRNNNSRLGEESPFMSTSSSKLINRNWSQPWESIMYFYWTIEASKNSSATPYFIGMKSPQYFSVRTGVQLHG